MVRLNAVYGKTDRTVARKIIDETILVPLKGNMADMQSVFTLNSTAAFIWNHLDGKRSLSIIKQDLIQTFDVDDEQAESDILEFVEDLLEAGLVMGE